MEFVLGLLVGGTIGISACAVWFSISLKRQPKLPKGVKRGERPDVRRVVLRPVNKDEPPSRVTKALFQNKPTRRLRDENDARDVD